MKIHLELGLYEFWCPKNKTHISSFPFYTVFDHIKMDITVFAFLVS